MKCKNLTLQAFNSLAFAIAMLVLSLLTVAGAQAAQFKLDVKDAAGNPISGFRYVLQEDTTFAVDPNNPATDADDILSLSFHASNQPVAKAQSDGSGLSGNTDEALVNITSVPPGRYYVSVLPYSGHSIGGMSVNVLPNAQDPGQTLDNVTVTVQTNPIPTTQIALFLFQDNWPLNGAPDLPEEDNPGIDGQLVDWSQFNIILEEPAGRYGQNGGQVIADAFGNPLGTTYDANGNVTLLGDGTLQPDPVTGTLLVQNLAPGKYGVIVTPPTGQGWQQTSTIEGSKVIDAWVKANEPPFFVEFGFPGPHVFVGFTQEITAPLGGTTDITGAVTDIHMSRPPVFDFFSGRAFPQCWAALSKGTTVPGETIYAAPCGPESDFTIAGVPAGNYTITIFDSNLDVVIGTLPITVDLAGTCNGGFSCDLGTEVGVFNWFHRINTAIFSDVNHNGFWDANEGPAGSERGPVVLRWRDGTIYQAFGTDTDGLAPFDEVFPFFHWLVAEVGFTRDKITGATFVVDAGGEIPPGSTGEFPDFGELNPQVQADGELWRTELGPVLTQAFQGFLGQTNVMQFGMTPYVNFTDPVFNFPDPPILPQFVGENGGISGMVLYAVVRAEDDPELAAAEEWEPGVPRVQVALYADGDIDCFPQGDFPNSDCDIDWNGDGILDPDDLAIDDVNGDGVVTLADVDNYPFDWYCQGETPCAGEKGPEDVNNSDSGLLINTFDLGDALNVTWTDSWDDSQPTGCQGVNNTPASIIEPPITDDRCFDGMRSYNQIRPGVFDGGWAFADYSTDALTAAGRGDIITKLDAFYADRINLVGITDAGISKLPDTWMIPGQYIVEAATPPGYKLMEEHHKNVDFGDEYTPALPQAFPATCVGDLHTVPPYMAMTTKDGGGFDLIPGIDPVDAAAPFANVERPLCDRKQTQLSAGQNQAVDFFVMTDVPIAGNVSGVALNDLANEFNPNSPSFGEKYAPPFTPVGFYDWNGAQVNRVYADQYGKFNALLPSTYTANLPQPSGMSPNMIVSCMNDAGPIPNPAFATDPDAPEFIIDPYFNPQFSQFCYTFQYMPGAITYLDTPVVSIAAFANPIEFPVDCERSDRTPMIQKVRRIGNGGGGPFVAAGGTVANPQRIRVLSMGGNVQVANPEWDGLDQATRFITRNYNFGGSPGTLQLEDKDGNRTSLNIINWGGTRINAEVSPQQAPGEYQVIVTRTAGVPAPVESPIGVTLTVGVKVGGTDYGVRPNSDGAPYDMAELYSVIAVGGNNGFATIQEGIDFADSGDLILVAPGVYDELPIMYKPVKLQGWGAGAVTINARQVPTEKVLAWRAKADLLLAGGNIDPLPGQELGAGFPALGAGNFPTEEGAGIFVAGKRTGGNRFGHPANRGARIDGFTIIGASQGGAIVANGYNQFLNISNNRLTTNAGFYGGGIRIGHPTLTNEIGGLNHTDAVNDRIRIHHNHIAQNGNTFGGAGAGISLHTGADQYRVKQNWICGNYSQGDGAGIGHFGRSHGGQIEDNIINFNESFAQANPVDGGGIFVGGKPGLTPEPNTGLLLSPGSGTVTIDANLIRGNQAGAGDGGGIRIHQANGVDIANSLNAIGPWYDVLVFNNMINNNVAGLAGGGISVEDSLRVVIRNNTVANNDSTATTAQAFDATDPVNTVTQTRTTPQPAGIVSRLHSPEMEMLMTDVTAGNLPTDWLTFSDPVLRDDIIYQNRSFFWLNSDDPNTLEIETGLFPATPDCIANAPACNTTSPNVNQFTDDLAVLDGIAVTIDSLRPLFSLLTDTTGEHPSNVSGDPDFVNSYFNGGRDNLNVQEFTTLQTAGAFDEGGNFIQVTYGPLSLIEPTPANAEGPMLDYHIDLGSAALNVGGNTPAGRLSVDFDNDPRPTDGPDIGADELQ